MAQRISPKEWKWYTERRARDLIESIRLETGGGDWVGSTDIRKKELRIIKRLFRIHGITIEFEI